MSDRIARAHRAKAALDEFIAPILADARDTYARRIVEIASTELDSAKRTNKITALSTALRVIDQLESGIGAVMMDGDVAQKDKLRADSMEQMTPSKRRLLGMVAGY